MIRDLAGQKIGATIVDATTGGAFVGTVTVYVTIDAGVQAIGSVGGGLCVNEGQSYYTYAPAQAETNGTLIAFTFIGTGAVPATVQVFTLTATQIAQLGAGAASTTAPTALDLITRAYMSLGVVGLEDGPLDAPHAQLGLRRLNGLIGQWATQALIPPTASRTVIPIVLGKGSEANPITIGPTGDVVMTTRPLELEGAGLLLSGVAPRVEIPRAVYTDAQWNAIAIKDLQASIVTGVFYTPTVPNGEIILWPVPDTTIHSLVVYRAEQLVTYGTLVTAYVLPDGYSDAIEFNLAVRLNVGRGEPVPPDLYDLARSSLANIKRANNTALSDLENDFAGGGGWYNILTG